jgi:hypothetical protein
VGLGAAAPGARAVPHDPQNLAFGSFGVPQLGQPFVSAAPHSRQNRRVAALVVPQFAQTMLVTLWQPPGQPAA